MNRLAGIVAVALGLIIAVLSIMKVIPGVTMSGFGLIVFGGLVIGLSFLGRPTHDEGSRMSTPNTLINIFFSPTEVFQNLRRFPRWLVPLLIMTVLSAVYTNLFVYRLTPERVANYTIDKTLEMPMVANNDDAKKQVEAGRKQAIEDAKNPVVRTGQAVGSFAGSAIWYCILGGLFMLFALAMGGQINFWQALSVAVYAAFPVAVIKFILNSIVLFIKDPTDIHPILGQGTLIQDSLNFLVVPSEHPVIFSLLGGFSLFGLYWIWLNATGLKNAGEKVSGSTAWTATIVLYVVGVLLMALMAFMFPSFIS
ncbi:MAG: YIP1 family protein [Pyrinomonadaceae bacterium]